MQKLGNVISSAAIIFLLFYTIPLVNILIRNNLAENLIKNNQEECEQQTK